MRDIIPALNNGVNSGERLRDEEGREGGSFWTMAGSLLVLVLVVGVGWFSTKVFLDQPYKAVFLNNNQVYFGKIAFSLDSNFITLKDAYYIRVDQIQTQGQGVQPNLLLAKLGVSEIHKPTSTMKINKSMILYIEELEPDSPIIVAMNKINENLNKQGQTVDNSQTQRVQKAQSAQLNHQAQTASSTKSRK